MEPRSCGARRNADDRRDLIEPEAEVVVEDDDRSVLCAQRRECPLERVAVGDLVGIEDARQLVVVGHDAHHRGPPAPRPARRSIAGPDDQPVQPGIEPGRVAEAGQVAPGRPQRLLHGVLRVVMVPEDADRDREEPVDPVAGQRVEGIGVAAGRPSNQLFVHRPSGVADRRPST